MIATTFKRLKIPPLRGTFTAAVALATLLTATVSKAAFVVDSLTGDITQNEINNFVSTIAGRNPPTNNWGNAMATRGTEPEGMWRMYEATKNRDILNHYIRWIEVCLSRRNDMPLGEHRVMWEDTIAPVWPIVAPGGENPGASGCESGMIAGYIAICAKLILETPEVWNIAVPDGNTHGFGVTYRDRALRYLSEVDHTCETYLRPWFVNPVTNRFKKPTDPRWAANAANESVTAWNRQWLFLMPFLYSAKCHDLLDDNPSYLATYKDMVHEFVTWFVAPYPSGGGVYYSSGGRNVVKWYYEVPTNQNIENLGHAQHDVAGLFECYASGYTTLTSSQIQPYADTTQYVINLGTANTWSNNVDGTGSVQDYPKSDFVYLAQWNPALFPMIVQSNIDAGQLNSDGGCKNTAYFLHMKRWRYLQTVPPAAPADLAAVPVSGSRADLFWPASERATSYTVKRATASGGPYTTIATGLTTTSFSNTGLANGTTYYYTVSAVNSNGEGAASAVANATTAAATLPGPWLTQDIGAVSATGSAGFNGGIFAVEGSGADVWGTADEFRYVYQPMSGDVEIIARVASVEATHDFAKAGVMIRESLAAGSKYAFMYARPEGDTRFQSRTTTGGTSLSVIGSLKAAPYWVRLVRHGSTFEGYDSPDGVNWNLVGSATISMTSAVYVGLPVTSHLDGTLCSASFDAVSVLPAPWQGQDIGAVGAAGCTAHGSGTFTADGAGADIWGAADEFHFVHQPASGSLEIIARVASVENTDAFAKVGVMIRESLGEDSKNVFIHVRPGGELRFQWRSAAGGVTSRVLGSPNGAPRWLRVLRIGNTFTGYESADGTNWVTVGSAEIAMAADVHVGMAVCSHADGVLCTSTFTNVSVDELSPPAFSSDPISKPDATEAAAYSGQTLAGSATDADADPLTYSKVSGPAWLSVASNGALSGTPGTSDVGLNSFVVAVTDGVAGSDQATLNLTVNYAPPLLVGHYTFDGGTAADSSGYANHGTFVNGAAVVTDTERGSVLNLDGVNDYVSLGNAASLNLSDNGQATIAAWIKMAASQNHNSIVTKGEWKEAYALLIKGDTSPKDKLWTGNDTGVFSGASVPLSTWTHVAVVINGDLTSFYINGQVSGTLNQDRGNAIDNTATGVCIGREQAVGMLPAGRWFFNGRMDDVMICEEALSQGEIQNVMDGLNGSGPASIVINQPTPIESWRMQHFGQPGNSGAAADTANPAGDGVVNLMKYALGMDPHVASTDGLPSLATANGFVRFQFQRNSSASDVTYTVIASDDLDEWTPLAIRPAGFTTWTESGASVTDESGKVTVIPNAPISSSPRRYLKMIVEKP